MAADEHLGGQFQPTYRTEHGSALVTPSGYVYHLSVKADRRGQGHGTELLQTITEHADTLGRPLELHAREELHPWYGRMGFERDTGYDDEEMFGHPKLVRKPRGRDAS